jgi:hypothetical protein
MLEMNWTGMHVGLFNRPILLTESFSDYEGALGAGMQALLLNRMGQDRGHRDFENVLSTDTKKVESLDKVVEWVESHNERVV